MFERSSGVLLHPTSLPGEYGIGTIGKEAYDFVDFLCSSGQKLWQMCPIGPTGFGNSPYQSYSAFAGNSMLIDIDFFIREGYIKKTELDKYVFSQNEVEFEKVCSCKRGLLEKAIGLFCDKVKMDSFFEDNDFWLDDYSLFMALKEHFNYLPWYEWDNDIRLRSERAICHYKNLLIDRINYHKCVQYVFYNQWMELKKYANMKGIKIIGDIPIFVAMDSVDVWANSHLFQLDDNLRPVAVAGVPPDYFSETGQLWGNPLYDWDRMKKEGYSWWIDVIRSKLTLFDIFRVDHFRGFAGYWRIPFGEDTAVNGSWEPGPGIDFFDCVKSSIGDLPIIAEDLGLITLDVIELRENCNFPGMKVLQFIYEDTSLGDVDEFINEEQFVVYTGTHDNDTVLGWFQKLDDDLKKRVTTLTGANESNIAKIFIEKAFYSGAIMSIVPLQDILGLGSSARMNLPGSSSNNWKWRFSKDQINENTKSFLKELTLKTGR